MVTRLGLAVLAGLLAIFCALQPTAGAAPDDAGLEQLSGRITIEVPGGRFTVTPPAGLCRYPKEVAERLSAFMHGQHVLLTGGTCEDVANLLRDGNAAISFSIVVTILDSDFDPATRQPRQAYLRRCAEEFPDADHPGDLAAAYADLERAGALHVGEAVPLGLLQSDRNYAVVGGFVSQLARADERVVQMQVVACLAPAGVPIFWMFQSVTRKVPDNALVLRELERVRATALRQIELTRELN